MNYKNRFYEKYSSTHTKSLYGNITINDIERQFKIWQSYFGKFLPKNRNAKILDLGCGNGGFVYWLQKIGYKNVEGVDISKEQITQAKKLGINNVKYADVFNFLKNKKGEYDLIFARDFLEHFTKDELLKIGELVNSSFNERGTFVSQTVNAENLFWGRLRHGDFTHDTAFTSQSIKQFLQVSGFKKVNIYPQRPVIHGIKSLIRYVLWRLLELWPKFYLLIETGNSKGIFTQNIIVEAKK